ncbi:MAG: hypothetical protein V9E81_02920 [Marmoricola sp.]
MSEAPTELPLLRLSDGLPPLVDTPAELAETIAALANAEGPVAIDAERASGFRYSARAYLIQIRRAGRRHPSHRHRRAHRPVGASCRH